MTRSRLRARVRRWLQRVPGPEAQPVTLVQRRVYVLPTPAGLGVLVMLGVMLIASMNYNLALGYAFTFLLAGAGIAHILATWRNLVGLRLAFRPEGESFAGGSAQFRATLDSARPATRHAIRVCDDDGAVLLDAQAIAAPAHSARLVLPAAQRGRLALGRLTIETCYPLGWVRAWSHIEPDAAQIIYPVPAGELPRESATSTTGHSQQHMQAGGEEEFAGLRERRPSDPPARIAWRRTARDGALLVKDFHALAADEGVLDWFALPAWLDTEARLSQLTQWVLAAQTAHARIALRMPDGQLGADNSLAHYRACLEHLALFGRDDAAGARP